MKSQIAIANENTSHDSLKSQSAISKTGRGGRRTPPWFITERGVVMAATVINTDRAIEASKRIVEVFVSVSRQQSKKISLDSRPRSFGTDFSDKLRSTLMGVLDSVVDHERQAAVKEEAQNLIAESIRNMKERLKHQGLVNEEIAAKVTKFLAEAERARALAAKTRVETETIEFDLIIKKLILLMEAQKAMTGNDLEGFIGTLKALNTAHPLLISQEAKNELSGNLQTPISTR